MDTLVEFPKAFQPIVVVTGDRREVPPQSHGDLLAYSVSCTDHMFINYLGLGQSQVLSDKQFVIEPEEVLRRRFGNTNILVIGSPAVNLLARRINQHAMFRFDIASETYEELEEQYRLMRDYIEPVGDDLFIYYHCLEGIIDAEAILRRFVGLEPNIDDLRRRAERIIEEFKKTRLYSCLPTYPRPIRYLMHKLDKPGMFDSLIEGKRGDSIGANTDYGLISVLDNPFSEPRGVFSVVYVAGVHGPGTALGVRLLANRKAFVHHPFGGVFEVKLNRVAPFFEKFQQSKERWETQAYDGKRYNDALERATPRRIRAFISSPAPKDDTLQKEFDSIVKGFLVSACHEMRHDLEIHDPYTLPMGIGVDFWENILNYSEGCFFVVHDVTNSSRGVMVEIGFSIGKKRKHFLVWNAKRTPVTEWRQMNVPSLLPTTNIESLNVENLSETQDCLSAKVVAKALDSQPIGSCENCDVRTPKKKDDACFVYAVEPSLRSYLENQLSERETQRVAEEESSRQSRLCRICETLRKARCGFVEVANKDRSGFIVLGMAKAAGVRTFAISLERELRDDFPWADRVTTCDIGSMADRLNEKVAGFLRSEFMR